MYLFVFVFIFLAILGLYTELLVMRLSHLGENQTVVAEMLSKWHGAAFQQVEAERENLTFQQFFTNNPAQLPCTMIKGRRGDPNSCPFMMCAHDNGWRNANPNAGKGQPGLLFLPDDMQAAFMGDLAGMCRNNIDQFTGLAANWNTIIYQNAASGQHYMLTYVPAGGMVLGWTVDQIYRQMNNNTEMKKKTYGMISNQCAGQEVGGLWLLTNKTINGNRVCVPVPTTNLPVAWQAPNIGAVGIVTQLGR